LKRLEDHPDPLRRFFPAGRAHPMLLLLLKNILSDHQRQQFT
jgi:hypothetical protein